MGAARQYRAGQGPAVARRSYRSLLFSYLTLRLMARAARMVATRSPASGGFWVFAALGAFNALRAGSRPGAGTRRPGGWRGLWRWTMAALTLFGARRAPGARRASALAVLLRALASR